MLTVFDGEGPDDNPYKDGPNHLALKWSEGRAWAIRGLSRGSWPFNARDGDPRLTAWLAGWNSVGSA